jgi:hypothetical protein
VRAGHRIGIVDSGTRIGIADSGTGIFNTGVDVRGGLRIETADRGTGIFNTGVDVRAGHRIGIVDSGTRIGIADSGTGIFNTGVDVRGGLRIETAERGTGIFNTGVDVRGGLRIETAERGTGIFNTGVDVRGGLRTETAEKGTGIFNTGVDVRGGLRIETAERGTGIFNTGVDMREGLRIETAERGTGIFNTGVNVLAEHGGGSQNAVGMFAIDNTAASVFISDALIGAKSANTSIFQIIQDVSGSSDRNRFLGGASRDWLREMDVASTGRLVTRTGLTLNSHLLSIASISSQAEVAIGSLLPNRFGLALSISPEEKNALTGSFVDFSHSYQNLWQSLETSPASMLSFSPALSRLPAIEYYNGAILTSRLSGEKETETDRDTRDEIVLQNRDVLNDFLSRLNPKLIAMRDGAREALKSTNPDRVRHFSISLRELFTQVVDQLAPKSEIQKWSSSPEHYSSTGKPTRRARLLYICRHINQKPLVRFVEKDIDAALEFMNLFQRGTHDVDAQYTPAQLTALEVRMDSTLRFIFEVFQQE